MPRRLTTEEFIEKAIAIHGDCYDYSQVEYKSAHTKVTIGCTEHGPFEQAPTHHLSGKGCPDCGGTRKLTKERFIERARVIHGDRYDYAQVEYVNGVTPVTINCLDHGPFDQIPNSHLIGRGCRECGGNKPLTSETFIEKAIAAHGNRYDYSSIDYVNAHTKVTIICLEHGPFDHTATVTITLRSIM